MERRFNEDQIREIVQRAAEYQVAHKHSPNQAAQGVSETELLRIAGELGIEKTALQAAINDIANTTIEDSGTIKSVDRIIERTIEGEVSEEDLSVVLQQFTPAAGIGNQPVNIGKSISYSSMVGMAQCNVNVTARNDRTSLQVKSNAGLAALPTFLPAFVMSALTNVIIWEEIRPDNGIGAIFAIGIPILLLTGAYFGFRKIVEHSNRKVLDLTNRVVTKLAQSADYVRQNLSRSRSGTQPEIDEMDSAELIDRT